MEINRSWKRDWRDGFWGLGLTVEEETAIDHWTVLEGLTVGTEEVGF